MHDETVLNLTLNSRAALTNKKLLILLLIYPTLTCLTFWVKVLTGANLDPGSYFNLGILVYLFYLAFEIKGNGIIINIVVYILFCIFCTAYYGTNMKDSFLYFVPVNNVLYALYILPKLDFSQINLQLLAKHLTIFAILFVVIYEASSHFAKGRVTIANAKFGGDERNYKEGFVISHFATYYLGALGFFLFIMKRRVLAVLLWVYAYTLGARIALIYIIVAAFVAIIIDRKKLLKIAHDFRYLVLLSMALLIGVLANRIISSQGEEGLAEVTSGRSTIWFAAWREMASKGFNEVNLLGRGPASSATFNYLILKIKIWMHNDFFEVVFTFGFVGLLIYLLAFFRYFMKIRFIYLFLIFFLSAFFNGFYTYDPLFIIVINTLVYRRFLEKGNYISLSSLTQQPT